MLSMKLAMLTMWLALQLTVAAGAIEDSGSSNLHKNRRPHVRKVKNDNPKKHKVRYTVSLQLPDVTMSHFLNDKSSTHYKELSQALTSDVRNLLHETFGNQTISNMNFSSSMNQQKKKNNRPEQFRKFKKRKPILPPISDSEPSSHSLATYPPYQSSSTARWNRNVLNLAPTVDAPVKLSLIQPSPMIRQSPVKTVTRKPKLSNNAAATIRLTAATKSTTSAEDLTSKSAETKESIKLRTSAPWELTTSPEPSTTSPEPATISSEPTTTSSEPATTSQQSITTAEVLTTTLYEKLFDAVLITRLFKECYGNTESREYLILLEPYITAYSKLISIFKILGPIFSFAEDDVKSKLNILQSLRKSDIELGQDNYVTFQSMFAYEHSPEGAKAGREGVSANAWIHRALKFISGFIRAGLEDSDTSLGTRAREIYSATLAPHHNWITRAGVYLVLLSIPSREALMADMGLTNSSEDRQSMEDLSSAIDAVYEDVESLYAKYSSVQ